MRWIRTLMLATAVAAPTAVPLVAPPRAEATMSYEWIYPLDVSKSGSSWRRAGDYRSSHRRSLHAHLYKKRGYQVRYVAAYKVPVPG